MTTSAESTGSVDRAPEALSRATSSVPAEPAAPTGGSSDGDLFKLVRSGPWLIVYGEGVAAEEVARAQASLVGQSGVSIRMGAVDEIDQYDLGSYFGLILVLPIPLLDERKQLTPFVRLLQAYRTRHPEGVLPLVRGRAEWFEVGVVQVIADRSVIDRPTARPLRGLSVDAEHDARRVDIDLFAVYADPVPTLIEDRMSEIEGFDEVRRHLQLLTDWNLRSASDVRTCLAAIERSRMRTQNNTRAKAMHRPVSNCDHTILDLILDGTWRQYPELDQRLNGNGGLLRRAWAATYDEMLAAVPSVKRPGRDGPGAVQQLFDLYESLRIVSRYYDHGLLGPE